MVQEDLQKLKQSVRIGDYFALIYFILVLLLGLFKVVSLNSIIGLIIGYISVKFVFEMQLKKFSKKEVSMGTNIMINILIYAAAMAIMTYISTSALFIGTSLIIVYRYIVLTKFKSLVS